MYNIFMVDNFDGAQNSSNPFAACGEDIELDFNKTEDDTIPMLAAGEHRLNDLDSNLFSESAYNGVDDEIFRLEYKINKLENKLKKVQLSIASAAAINDFQQLNILNGKKKQYEKELQSLYKIYNNQSIPSKLSGEILNLVTQVPDKSSGLIQKAADFLNKYIFSKVSDKFDSALHIKEALIKLENINKNVDDLVSMQTPYGESSKKYERLLQYLNKANTIQYQISQMVEGKEK